MELGCIDAESGGSVTTHRANIVSGDRVELLSTDPRTMSVPKDSQHLQNFSLHFARLFRLLNSPTTANST